MGRVHAMRRETIERIWGKNGKKRSFCNFPAFPGHPSHDDDDPIFSNPVAELEFHKERVSKQLFQKPLYTLPIIGRTRK